MLHTLGDEWVEQGMRARMNRVVEAREAVAKARNDILGVALPANLAEMWPTLDVEDQRSFLADGIEVIAVARARLRSRTGFGSYAHPSCNAGGG
jgi:hypothetical protein